MKNKRIWKNWKSARSVEKVKFFGDPLLLRMLNNAFNPEGSALVPQVNPYLTAF